MDLTFKPVQSSDEIKLLAKTANEVWHEYFSSLLSLEQINYMVEKFQSAPALTDQITNQGYEYFLLMKEGEILGYTGLQKKEDGRLFLSKLYLLKQHRGKGYASRAFAFMRNYCKENNLRAIYLTVNKYNESSIAVYLKKGFQIIDSQVNDIGRGFVMDDYIMQWTLQ